MIAPPSRKYFFLLVSLVFLFVFYGPAQALNIGPEIYGLFLSLVLLAGLVSVRNNRTHLKIGIGLFSLSLIRFLVTDATPATASLWMQCAASLASMLFFGLLILLILEDIFQNSKVTSDKIMGSVCSYILLGLFWFSVFSLIQHLQPGSFSMGGETIDELPVPKLLYFSFVTLTTLGYGDITPLTPIAEAAALLEALSGQLYLTILVALLVGLLIHSLLKNDPNPP